MNVDFTEHLPEDFADNSRVWIYQSSRLFFISEALEMEDMLNNFVANWKSHEDGKYFTQFTGDMPYDLAAIRQKTGNVVIKIVESP